MLAKQGTRYVPGPDMPGISTRRSRLPSREGCSLFFLDQTRLETQRSAPATAGCRSMAGCPHARSSCRHGPPQQASPPAPTEVSRAKLSALRGVASRIRRFRHRVANLTDRRARQKAQAAPFPSLCRTATRIPCSDPEHSPRVSPRQTRPRSADAAPSPKGSRRTFLPRMGCPTHGTRRREDGHGRAVGLGLRWERSAARVVYRLGVGGSPCQLDKLS